MGYGTAMTPALGAIPSPRDYRDEYVAGALAGVTVIALPESFNTDLPGKVLDQQLTPSCVGHAMAQTMKQWWFIKTGEVVDFSPRFLDTLAKRYDGVNRLTEGTYPRLVCKLASQFGCATIKTVPNNTGLGTLQYRDDAVLTAEAFAEALKYRTPGYVRVNTDQYSIRLATSLYGAVSGLMQIDSQWWLPSWRAADIDPVRTPKVGTYGHEVVYKGWSGTFDRLRNSWGKEWNTNGEARFSSALWRPWMIEAWAIAQIPKNVSDFIKTLPSPSSFQHHFQTDLARNSQSEEVKFAQIALMILGHLAPIAPDELGYFGVKTAAANGTFQREHGISPVPGRIGPLTRGQLNAIFWK